MHEDVLILLNEREPLKSQMAEELEQQLTARHLAVERLKPSRTVARRISERAPRVLVLDYLLGDFGTALDVLQYLATELDQETIQTILWTDEPSVHVAVTAMKLGAEDYIEISSPQALNKILQAISTCLKEPLQKPPSQQRVQQKKISSLVYQDSRSRECLAQALAVVNQNQEVAVILGEPGTGRNALAQYLHSHRQTPGSYIEIDLDTWVGSIDRIFGSGSVSRTVPLLSSCATVMIDHAEFDTGELLDATNSLRQKIWPGTGNPNTPMLIIGTSNPGTADAWQRVTNASVIQIPPLRERNADFLPLLQKCLFEATNLGKANQLDPSPALLEELSALDWPGNIRQFRTAVLDALMTPLDLLRESSNSLESSETPDNPEVDLSLSDTQQLLLGAIRTARDRWQRHEAPAAFVPEPLAARNALDKAHGNIRVAAATMGTGIPQLREALGLSSSLVNRSGLSNFDG